VATRYERVTFELDRIELDDKPRADLLAPGHPLHDAVAALTIAQLRPVLDGGTVLVSTEIDEPQLLVGVVEEVVDGIGQPIARRFGYAVGGTGAVTPAGPAPYLDCVGAPDTAAVAAATKLAWLLDAEAAARTWIIGHQLKEYLAEVSPRRLTELHRTRTRVDHRLASEANRLIGEAMAAREKEQAGMKPKESSEGLMRKAADLQARREARLALLDQQAQLSTRPPCAKRGQSPRAITAARALPVMLRRSSIRPSSSCPGAFPVVPRRTSSSKSRRRGTDRGCGPGSSMVMPSAPRSTMCSTRRPRRSAPSRPAPAPRPMQSTAVLVSSAVGWAWATRIREASSSSV
jgi:hypothetical protein